MSKVSNEKHHVVTEVDMHDSAPKEAAAEGDKTHRAKATKQTSLAAGKRVQPETEDDSETSSACPTDDETPSTKPKKPIAKHKNTSASEPKVEEPPPKKKKEEPAAKTVSHKQEIPTVHNGHAPLETIQSSPPLLPANGTHAPRQTKQAPHDPMVSVESSARKGQGEQASFAFVENGQNSQILIVDPSERGYSGPSIPIESVRVKGSILPIFIPNKFEMLEELRKQVDACNPNPIPVERVRGLIVSCVELAHKDETFKNMFVYLNHLLTFSKM